MGWGDLSGCPGGRYTGRPHPDLPLTARVFVYGTLMRGGHNHGLLAAARFAGEARTAPRYTLVSMGDWPALLEGGGQSVAGELFLVAVATLAALDALEGAPTLYQRRPVTLADGSLAVAYVKPAALALGRPVVASGDWRRR